MTDTVQTEAESGVEIFVPLNKLKKSPRNVRKVPHAVAEIEALAASIHAKRMFQNLVVEPEFADGEPTGFYFVTAGEGRRLAQVLRAKRKQIKKTEPIRCILDTDNDPAEISLDENVTRTAMHPADQFEAFRDLAERKGWGAEAIGARFGVTAQVVKQRLRLGAVSPKLLQVYRDGGLNLDQMMAFAVSEDHARQEQVYEQLSWNKSAQVIRRAMTETKVPASDRRANFVGVEAYAEAGGTVLRDLFTEDGGGWLDDVALLDRLTQEKLDRLAADIRGREGWKWAQGCVDHPHSHGFARAYPIEVESTPERRAEMAALAEEYDALVDEWDAVEDVPPEVEARFREIDAVLEAYGPGQAYDPDDIARGGVFVVLGPDGEARFERGLIRPGDAKAAVEIETKDEAAETIAGEGGEDVEVADDIEGGSERGADIEETDDAKPPSDSLIRDLTAHRTLGLRLALGERPDVAMVALTHAMAARLFYHGDATCLEIRVDTETLEGHAEGIADTRAAEAMAERHDGWAAQLPRDVTDLWAFMVALDGDSRSSLLAHCVSLSVNAVRLPWERKTRALAAADVLASATDLDMTAYWTPTARSYFGRVTKAQIAEAVAEAVSPAAAERIRPMKKPDMAEAAEQLVAGTGWLPLVLQAPCLIEPEGKAAVLVSHRLEGDLAADDAHNLAAE